MGYDTFDMSHVSHGKTVIWMVNLGSNVGRSVTTINKHQLILDHKKINQKKSSLHLDGLHLLSNQFSEPFSYDRTDVDQIMRAKARS